LTRRGKSGEPKKPPDSTSRGGAFTKHVRVVRARGLAGDGGVQCNTSPVSQPDLKREIPTNKKKGRGVWPSSAQFRRASHSHLSVENRRIYATKNREKKGVGEVRVFSSNYGLVWRNVMGAKCPNKKREKPASEGKNDI